MAVIQIHSVFRFYPDCLPSYNIYYLVYYVVKINSIDFFYYGDLQLILGLDQLPHLEVPYPLTHGGQQLRHASGRCPVHLQSVTFIFGIENYVKF